MKRIRIQKPRPRGRYQLEALPLDPRDRDVVRAKTIMRAKDAGRAPAGLRSSLTGRTSEG